MRNDYNYDVVIAGGGIAGCSAAYIAGKSGLKTLLIEKQNYLGGLITGGLVVPMMKSDCKQKKSNFYNDLIEYSKKFNSNITYGDDNSGWFNPIMLKIILDNMLTDSNVDILFENEIEKIKFNNYKYELYTINNFKNILSLPICSKYIIDSTSSGIVSKMLGADLYNDNNGMQPATLRFIVSNVDTDKFVDFLMKLNDDKDNTNYFKINNENHFTTAFTWDKNKKWGLEPYFKEALEKNILKNEDLEYFQIFSIAGMPNSVAFNCPRLRDDKKDVFSRSKAIVEARKSIYRLYNFVKKCFVGFEYSYISNIADIIGDRESGRVMCEYNFTSNDIKNGKTFEDAIFSSNYPIDIHSNTQNCSILSENIQYDFPLRSLKVKGLPNIYAIGKCCGADIYAHGSLRIQKNVIFMGEAVVYDILKHINQ